MTERRQLLADARAAMQGRRWADAHDLLIAARAQGELDAEDLVSLGEAAWWRGEIDECLSCLDRAYQLFLAREDPPVRTAGKLAMEVGYYWALRGEEIVASGWFERARRLLEPFPESAEFGYLTSTAIDTALAEGDFDAALAIAHEVLTLSQRHGDETLSALALVGQGIARIKLGEVTAGLATLDEAMLPVVAGRVQAAYAGNIYCQLMQVCHELADFRRARQWTDATARWCEGFERGPVRRDLSHPPGPAAARPGAVGPR